MADIEREQLRQEAANLIYPLRNTLGVLEHRLSGGIVESDGFPTPRFMEFLERSEALRVTGIRLLAVIGTREQILKVLGSMERYNEEKYSAENELRKKVQEPSIRPDLPDRRLDPSGIGDDGY